MAIALDGNNPGGINDGPFCQAQPGYRGPWGRYGGFTTLQFGVDAMRTLLAGYLRKGFKTPRMIVGRYAPRADGNDEVTYARKIVRGFAKLGLTIGLDDPIPTNRVGDLVKIMATIENPAFPARYAKECANG